MIQLVISPFRSMPSFLHVFHKIILCLTLQLTDNVDFYNILNHNGNSEAIMSASDHFATAYMKTVHTASLSQLMNGPIKKALRIPSNVTWGGMSISNCVCVLPQLTFMQCICYHRVPLVSKESTLQVIPANCELCGICLVCAGVDLNYIMRAMDSIIVFCRLDRMP